MASIERAGETTDGKPILRVDDGERVAYLAVGPGGRGVRHASYGECLAAASDPGDWGMGAPAPAPAPEPAVRVAMPCRGCGVQVRVPMRERMAAWCAGCLADGADVFGADAVRMAASA